VGSVIIESLLLLLIANNKERNTKRDRNINHNNNVKRDKGTQAAAALNSS